MSAGTLASITLSSITAPTAWRSIDVISDLHLAENTPRAFAAWADYLMTTRADAVFILGDLFEAWVGDDARHEGFEAKATAVLKAASEKRSIWFMLGNRDFLLGREMLEASGMQALPDPCVIEAFGTRTLFTHGDAWCIDDVDYQRMRQVVRNPAWQTQALARPLLERRELAKQLRSESERRFAEHRSAGLLGGDMFDVDRSTALKWMQLADVDTLVHGHTHRPGSEAFDPGKTRHVLSDWELDHAAAPRAGILRWSATGWQRLNPLDAQSIAC